MNRKYFVVSLFSSFASLSLFGNARFENAHSILDESALFHRPDYLVKGDTIAIVSPAGFITVEDIKPAVKKLEEWGYNVVVGNSVGKKDFTFGGTDEERLLDFQTMLDKDDVKAILCARGGYGIVRIIDKINFKKFIKRPKWIIGFSDITVLHNHINRNCGIVTLHSKMCNSFPSDWSKADEIQQQSIDSIHDALSGNRTFYQSTPNLSNRTGKATAALVGGNLRCIENLAGTKSDIITRNKILFLEDTDEYLYNIDRMFWNLKRTGKLEGLKGLVIGGFKTKKDDEGEEFGKTLEQIVIEKVKEYPYPVCFDFPVGHQKNNMALQCGALYTLEVKEDKVQLFIEK
jgi:muramoyltetrapeptide carboxypeptidase